MPPWVTVWPMEHERSPQAAASARPWVPAQHRSPVRRWPRWAEGVPRADNRQRRSCAGDADIGAPRRPGKVPFRQAGRGEDPPRHEVRTERCRVNDSCRYESSHMSARSCRKGSGGDAGSVGGRRSAVGATSKAVAQVRAEGRGIRTLDGCNPIAVSRRSEVVQSRPGQW
jgi:hypothetical protein